MSAVGERETRTQRRVIAFLTDALGYAYLGHWQLRIPPGTDWYAREAVLNRWYRRHNDRFYELMSQFMPQWQLHRDELNEAPLAHADWKY